VFTLPRDGLRGKGGAAVRGSLSQVLSDAAEISSTRLALLRDLLDGTDSEDMSGPFGGESVPLHVFKQLLLRDPVTQDRTAAMLPFMTDQERSHLKRLVESAPAAEQLPPENTAIPLSGTETSALRRGTGG
jgi:hypothetical protein